jgi:hypothetical protein
VNGLLSRRLAFNLLTCFA